MTHRSPTSEDGVPETLIKMAGFSRRWCSWLRLAFPELTFLDSGDLKELLGEFETRPFAALLLGPKLKPLEVSEVLACLPTIPSRHRPYVIYCAGREGWDRSGEGLDRLLLPPLGRRRLASELSQLFQNSNSVNSEERAALRAQPTTQKLFRNLSRALAVNSCPRVMELTQQLSIRLKDLDLPKANETVENLAVLVQQNQLEEALLSCLRLRSQLYPISWMKRPEGKFPRLWLRVKEPTMERKIHQLAISEGFEVVVSGSQESPIGAFLLAEPDAVVLSLPPGQPGWVDALLMGWPNLPQVIILHDLDQTASDVVERQCHSILMDPVSPAYILERLCFQVDRRRQSPYRVCLADSQGRNHDDFRQALSDWEVEVGDLPSSDDALWLMDDDHLEQAILTGDHPPIWLLREAGQISAAAVDSIQLPLCLGRFFERVQRVWNKTSNETLMGGQPWMEARFCIEQLFRLAARHGQPSSLAVLRIFEGSELRAQRGRLAVQESVARLSSVLKIEMRAGDVVARLSESTLLLAMYGMRRADGMTRLAPHLAGDVFNAGLAEYPEDGDDLRALLQAAEVALDTAELAGSGRVVYVGWSEDLLSHRVDILFITYADSPNANELTQGFRREGYSHRRWNYDPTKPVDLSPQNWRLCLVEPPQDAQWHDFAPILEAFETNSRNLVLWDPKRPLSQDWKSLGTQVDSLSLMKCLREQLGFKGAWTVRSRPDGSLRRRQTLFSQLNLARRDQEQAEAMISSMQKRQEKLSSELALAHDIQQNLLPRRVPSMIGWEFYFAVVPSRVVGGDLVHCSNSPEGSRVALADVSGKGVPAAILVGSLHEILRTTENLPLPQAVEKINDAFFRITPSEVSVALLLVDFAIASGRAEICNCGCPQPLWIQDQRVTPVGGSGLPLGWFAESMPEYSSIELKVGQTLLLHSDGLSDAFLPGSRERVGESRIQKLLESCGHFPLPELASQLMCLLDQETQPDDVALWVARRNPSNSQDLNTASDLDKQPKSTITKP